jgi:AcrR family transcriptional regulator
MSTTPDHHDRLHAWQAAHAEDPGYSDRHREVLYAAMELIAERGLKGASLRELARRVGIAQPSLYTYFKAKEELVEQIITLYTYDLMAFAPRELPELDRLSDVVRGFLFVIVGYYSQDQYVTFIRFLFVVSFEQPESAETIRSRFLFRGMPYFHVLAQPFVERGEILSEDVEYLARAVIGSLVLEMLQRRVMLDEPFDYTQWVGFVDFIADTLVEGVRARALRTSEAS